MKLTKLILSTLLAIMPPLAIAHHGWGTQYDTTKEIELSGVVKSLDWTNPHVKFQVVVADKTGDKTWTIESNSVSNLSRMGVTKNLVAVGAHVKVAGFGPGPSASFGLFMNHLLFVDGPNKGKEIVFLRGAAPRWSDDTIGNDDALHGKVVENDINKRPATIFSVWTVVYNDNDSHGLHTIGASAAATAAPPPPPPAAGMSGTVPGCIAKSLIQIMATPYPVQLIEDAKNKKIIFKAEENDTVREILLTPEHKTTAKPSLTGYSTGVLDPSKKKLTVTTSNVEGALTTVYTETFELSADRNRINYTVKTNNSAVVQGRYWQYQPGASVMKYGCTN